MSAATGPICDLVLVAAGSGSRLGADLPKAFVEISGEPLLRHAMRGSAAIDPRLVAITVPSDDPARWSEAVSELALPGKVEAIPGGQTRQDSVRLGLESIRRRFQEAAIGKPDVVLVHDAARPCASAEIWRAVRDSAL